MYIIFSRLYCRWYALLRLDLLVVRFRPYRLVMHTRGGTSRTSVSILMRSFRLLLPAAVTLLSCSWPSVQRHCCAYAASNSTLGR